MYALCVCVDLNLYRYNIYIEYNVFRFCRDSAAVFKHSSVHLYKCVDVAMIVICVHTYKHNMHGN